MNYYILLLVIVIVIYLSFTFKEHLTLTSDTIKEDELDFVKYLLTSIIEKINKDYKLKMALGTFDRIEFIPLKDNEMHYKVKYYIYSRSNYINRKIDFDFVYNKKDNIIKINSIKGSEALENLLERSPISERTSTLYKPKYNEEPKHNLDRTNLEYTNINIKEDSVKELPLKRNKTILPNKIKELVDGNYTPYSSRKVDVVWNSYGISNIEKKGDREGIYHGRVTPKVFPTFHPSQFVRQDKGNTWLFDLGADSSSRPVGVGSAQ